MGIIIGADFVPTKSNEELFMNSNIEKLIGLELIEILKSADYRIINLEIPLTNSTIPIKKRGMNLSAHRECISAYSSLDINLAVLANNHILDYGNTGLFDTIEVLGNVGIDYVGAGRNKYEAAEPYVFKWGERKIGVYACVQHEYSEATDSTAGANCFDLLDSFDQINELKRKCDYLIVLYHGGRECYRYPTPYLQKLCHKIIEKGANIVICQHSHCIGCEEKYLNGTIVYGQGNFLFDMKDNEYWNTSLLIEIQDDLTINYIPIEKFENCVRLADNIKSQRIMEEFFDRTEKIKEKGYIDNEFQKLAINEFYDTLYYITGQETLIFRVINRIFKNKLREVLYKKKYNDKYLLFTDNTLNCESHFELLRKGIEIFKEH